MGELSYPPVGATGRVRVWSSGVALVIPFTFGAISVIGLGAANGGYFASSWGYAVLAFAGLLVWALSIGADRPSFLSAAFVSGLAAFALWIAVSGAWGKSATSIDEAVRALVYVVGAAAALAVVRRHRGPALIGGVVAGACCIAGYALLTRLFPERIGSFDSVAVYRLSTPVGYWNALGLLSVVAILLALALVVRASTARAAALAGLPVPVLAGTLYFTFSRGSWISLGIGLVIALALDPRRLQLFTAAIALAVPAGVGVLVASHSDALTHQLASVAQASHDGHRLAVLLVFLTVASAVAAASYAAAARRIVVPTAVGRVFAATLLAIAVAALAAGVIRGGGAAESAHKVWRTFASPPANATVDLRKRLFSFSGNHRTDLWRASGNEFRAHPIAGGGAGSYESYWLAHRTWAIKVRDAHSLYVETLGELGIVGLVVLLVALGAPLVAAARARRVVWVPAAAGAYVAYLVGAGVDWDWEIPALTLAAILTAAALLSAARDHTQLAMSIRMRSVLIAATIPIVAFAFVFLVGQMKLSRASTAAASANWTQAARDARSAASWLPWSTRPWQQLGQAQLAEGDTHAARVSFDKAIAKDSGDWSLWFDLARASNGKPQKVALARATRLNPLSPEIRQLKLELASAGTINGS